jgi:hypothetical protein
MVQCVISGKNHRQSALVTELPVPAPPTGLYGRQLDPFALDDLGYQRDSAVCATLETPDEEEIAQARKSMDVLGRVRAAANKEAAIEGRCICQTLQELDSDDLIPLCVGRPTRMDCEVSEESIARAKEIITPVERALAEAHVPHVHWRLVGVADRPDRFAAWKSEIIKLHPGGSEVYVRGAPIVGRGNHELLEALFEIEEVQVVVRQDSGRALLVIRQMSRGQLVLDHFSYPRLGNNFQPIVSHLDNRQIQRYKLALERPAEQRKLLFDPSEGTIFEFDRSALDRLDRSLVEATVLEASRYSEAREVREVAPVLVDRMALQIPIGHDGEVLRAKLEFTTAGEAWLAKFGQEDLFANLHVLLDLDVEPTFTLGGKDPGFVLRGSPLEQSLFGGVNAMPALMEALDGAMAGSLDGTTKEWTLDIPAGPLPGELDTRPGLQRLRERLSKTPHRLSGKMSGPTLELELRPK